MNRILLTAALAATALSACSKDDHTIVAGSKEDNAVNAAAVVLPPAIESSKSYRCKDNSVVYIDWLSDKKTADLRSKKEGEATRVMSAEAGQPMTAAGGFSLTGTKDSASVTVERAGKGSQSCKG
ncbi:MAG: hypothetical protein ABIQ98_02135 [Sphingomicrobium sp.]